MKRVLQEGEIPLPRRVEVSANRSWWNHYTGQPSTPEHWKRFSNTTVRNFLARRVVLESRLDAKYFQDGEKLQDITQV